MMSPDGVPVQYSMQYPPSAGKVMPVENVQAVPPSNYNTQPAMTARDWQHSVASVYDPQGLKRRWNNSVDMSNYNNAKRAR